MELGNALKYDKDTLKLLLKELNEAGIESGGWIASATKEKIYSIIKGGRLVVTPRLRKTFTYEPKDTPTYCSSPYRPTIVEWDSVWPTDQDKLDGADLIASLQITN